MNQTANLKRHSSIYPEPAWDIAKLFPPQGQWDADDYLRIDTNRLVELRDGNLEVLDPPTESHQGILGFLLIELHSFVREHDLGNVLMAAFPVRLAERTFREPDLVFMKKEHASRRHNKYWECADLVMEVVNEDDRDRDLVIKRSEYARAAIEEYWIVDPQLSEIAVLKLTGDQYETAEVYHPGDQAISVLLPGFGVDVTAIFEAK